MYRGMITFKCSQCGAKFSAPDMEWLATSYSTPQPCPECNSRRTYPAMCWPFSWLTRHDYEKIWNHMEKQNTSAK